MLAPFSFMGGSIDAQAQAHFNRVIADGGVIPAGLNGVNSFFSTVKSIYGTSNINTAISAAYDPHYLGYKMGAGSGTTLGQAAQTLYSTSGASADVTQGTAASQPLLLTHTGQNYWFGSGVSGNFVSTPDASANRITSDMEIVCHVNLPNYAPVGAEQQLVSKYGYSENNRCYSFGFLTSNNKLTFRASLDGTSATLSASATANCTLTANTNGYLKVTYDQNNGSGQYEVKFFQSTDGINYTQIGSTVTGASIGNTFTGAAPLLIGSIGSLATNTGVVNGRILRTTISNSIGGTPVVDFNPQQYTPSVSQTSWVSTTGETWTLNVGTATTGYKGVLVDRSIVQGDGVDDKLYSSSVMATQPNTIYLADRVYSKTTVNFIVDGDNNFRNSFFDANSSSSSIFAGAVLSLANTSLLLKLRTAIFNSSSSSLQINNGTATTGDAGTNNLRGLHLFSQYVTTFGNGQINSVIISDQLDNSTQRTALYDYVRQINNNAF